MTSLRDGCTGFAVAALLCVYAHLASGQTHSVPVFDDETTIAANRTPLWILRRLQQTKGSLLSRARVAAMTEVYNNAFFAFDIDGAEGLTIVLKPYASIARFRNTFGYYLKDETGRPYRGRVIWADVGQAATKTLRINRQMLGKAKGLAFFVIPDGARLNPHLRNGAAVGVAKYLNEWTVVRDGISLKGASLPAFFSELQFNADGVGHVLDSKAPGNFNWEDGYRGGDNSFDDVNIDVSAIVDFPPKPESEVPLIARPSDPAVAPVAPTPPSGEPRPTPAPEQDLDNDKKGDAAESVVMDSGDDAGQRAVVPEETDVRENPFWRAISGFGEVELTAFPLAPRFERQSDEWLQQSIAGSVQYAQDVGARGEALVEIFARYDKIDEQRSYVDVQRAHLAHFGDTVSLRAGVLNETWGVLELENIVDIVNQRNTAEDFRADAKLGQPGVKLSFPVFSFGQADLYYLPYPRRRPFAGDNGRFQVAAIPIDDDDVFRTSAAQDGVERWVKQGAGRLQFLFGGVEVAVSHFHGTSRDPAFDVALDGVTPVALTPTYERIDQSGIELRAIALGNVLKAEAFRRTEKGSLDDSGAFYGAAAGIERDFVRVFGSDVDLTLFGEYYYDDRDMANGAVAPVPLDNDIFIGGRLGFNDLADTQLLLTSTTDVDTAATLLALELKRRIGDRLQLTLKGDAFINSDEDRSQRALQDDHRISLRARYFY